VVRRAAVDVLVPPRWGEWVELATWCAGIGGRWAERRLTISGEHGGHVETSTLWVHVDPATMAPARLPAAFTEIYGEAAGGRRVSARHWLSPPPPHLAEIAAGSVAEAPDLPQFRVVERVTWPLRAVDFDVMRHVNNAAYWAAIEELLAARPGEGPHPRRGRPVRAVLEYGAGIEPGATVELLVGRGDARLDVWFRADGALAASARLTEL
jgi:acyl-ACP thioesterase